MGRGERKNVNEAADRRNPVSLSRRTLLAGTAGLAFSITPGCREAPPSGAAQPSEADPPASAPPTPEPSSAVTLPSPPLDEDPLLRRFPVLARRTPHLALARLPSPLSYAETLGHELGLPLLFVKRDDAFAPLYAGGKVRKLAYYLAEARERGAKRIVTLGATGSHQAVATAAHGHAQGFDVTVLLAPTQMDDEQRRHVIAVAALGATIELVRGLGAAFVDLQKRAARDPSLYVIPAGGSSPLGTVGFLRAGLELAEQVRRGALPEPDRLYVPLGTMGTAIGLALGLSAAGLRTRVHAVRVSNRATSSDAEIRRLTKETCRWLTERDPAFGDLAEPRFTVVGDQLGRGYAAPTKAAEEAVDLASKHGFALETTYTGKCLAALMADAKTGGAAMAKETIVFWNTHSSLALPGGEADGETLPAALRAAVRARKK